MSFNVTIVDNENIELDEVFAGSLSVVTIGPDAPAVQLLHKHQLFSNVELFLLLN